MIQMQQRHIPTASTPVHGVMLEMLDLGVLLTGASGVGKSELALELIGRGHCLIADDAPEFTRVDGGVIEGGSPALLHDFLQVRGLGLLNVRRIFGDGAIGAHRRLDLIVNLVSLDTATHFSAERTLTSARTNRNILDVIIPQVDLPVYPGRNLATWVECVVRDTALRRAGYHADQDFAERLQRRIKSESTCE